MKIAWREKGFYLLLAVIFGVLGVDAAGGFFCLGWAQHSVFDLLKAVLPLVLLVAHSAYSLSLKRGLALILFLALGGLVAEIIGLKTGILFGGFYHYLPEGKMIFSEIALFNPRFFLWGVPPAVILYWAVFIYAGYSITNSFLFWQGKEKPSYRNKDVQRLIKLIALDVWIVMVIDLLVDPVMVRSGNWFWEQPGVYYGVPGGNFIGWGVVTACLSGMFRIFEYKFPHHPKRSNRFIVLSAVLCLSALFVLAMGIAVSEMMYVLIPVALAGILPVILTNFYFFFSSKC